MKRKLIFLIFLMIMSSYGLVAESVRISQLDTSSLLLNQKVHLYLSITDDEGMPVKHLKKDVLRVKESINNKDFESKEILSIHEGVNYSQGINFLLLLDNSGSMYVNDIQGQKVTSAGNSRIYKAKAVLRDFIGSVSNPKDKVGVVAYNSFYKKIFALSDEKDAALNSLNQISKPRPEAAYTEIYGSLELAAREFEKVGGRKAIILLTDGVNEPYYGAKGKEHPVFKKRIVKYQEAVKALQKTGVSAYIVHLGSNRHDEYTSRIASETGGIFFKANNEDELKNIYHFIVGQILSEYYISYRAGIKPVDQTHVKVDFKGQLNTYTSSRHYFSGQLLGSKITKLQPWILSLTLAGILTVLLLGRLKFERQSELPSIEILNDRGVKVSKQMVYLGEDKTFIGSSDDDNITIAGLDKIEAHHAQIEYNKDEEQFTIMTTGEVMVNNNPVKKKVLSEGDVIDMDGVTMVFDPGAQGFK